MTYKHTDLKTGEVTVNDLTELPYISITKDTLILMNELLSPEQIGNVFFDIVNELYFNGEYEPQTKTRTEKVMLNAVEDNIGRLSAPYFKKIKNLKNNEYKDRK